MNKEDNTDMNIEDNITEDFIALVLVLLYSVLYFVAISYTL